MSAFNIIANPFYHGTAGADGALVSQTHDNTKEDESGNNPCDLSSPKIATEGYELVQPTTFLGKKRAPVGRSTTHLRVITRAQRVATPPPSTGTSTMSALKQVVQCITTELKGHPDLHRQEFK